MRIVRLLADPILWLYYKLGLFNVFQGDRYVRSHPADALLLNLLIVAVVPIAAIIVALWFFGSLGVTAPQLLVPIGILLFSPFIITILFCEYVRLFAKED